MATTDKRILDLIEVVKKKRAEIAKAQKPDWKTNGSFSYTVHGYGSDRVNIQTITDSKSLVEILSHLLVHHGHYGLANTTLGTRYDFKWGGFTLEEWVSDLKSRLAKIEIAEKKAELTELENRLDKIISPELRAEMELNAITEALSK